MIYVFVNRLNGNNCQVYYIHFEMTMLVQSNWIYSAPLICLCKRRVFFHFYK